MPDLTSAKWSRGVRPNFGEDELARIKLFHEGIESGGVFAVDGVKFDLTAVTDLRAKKPKALIDIPSMHALALNDYGLSYFYPPVYTDPIEFVFAYIEFWPCLAFPWQRPLSRRRMLEELNNVLAVPELAAACCKIVGMHPVQRLAEAWLTYADSLLVRVHRGDTVRASIRAEVVLTSDPFATEADRIYTEVTLELWRRGNFRAAAVSPLCVRHSESLVAPEADFLEITAARVLARSPVRKFLGYRKHPDGGESWNADGPFEMGPWDVAASAWFGVVRALELAKSARSTSSFGDLWDKQMKDHADQALLEAGAKFGWLAKDAETADLMRPEALKHYARRDDARRGVVQRNLVRKQQAKAKQERFQCLAAEVWARHPSWGKRRVAQEVAKMTGQPVSTIRQIIQKPDSEESTPSR